MFRVSYSDTVDGRLSSLCGYLAGPWADELRSCWKGVRGKEITSPLSLLARFEGDKVACLQFLEDSYGNAGSFKTEGATRFHSDPAGEEVEA